MIQKPFACIITACLAVGSASACSAATWHDLRGPRVSPSDAPHQVIDKPVELRNVPDFGSSPEAATGTALKAEVGSTTVPIETRMKLVVEYPIDAKTSNTGDIFEAHVKDDMFIGNQLILARGSLVRGRVAEIVKPRLLSRAARIGLKLEQICTPTGEVIPLDAALEFQKGVTNKKGELDPGTSFGTKVGDDLKTVTGLNASGGTRTALMAANVATLGAPAVATLIGGSAIALFSHGDNISLQPGQEIEVLLTNDLGLQLN